MTWKAGPWSIEEIREREAAIRRHDEAVVLILDPVAGETAPLFASGKVSGGCLTHITRYVSRYPDRSSALGHPWPGYDCGRAWCGVSMTSIRSITLEDASGFGCWKCIERCEELGLPTFSLVPDTGCAASGGKRGRNLGRKHGEYAPRERFR